MGDQCEGWGSSIYRQDMGLIRALRWVTEGIGLALNVSQQPVSDYTVPNAMMVLGLHPENHNPASYIVWRLSSRKWDMISISHHTEEIQNLVKNP